MVDAVSAPDRPADAVAVPGCRPPSPAWAVGADAARDAGPGAADAQGSVGAGAAADAPGSVGAAAAADAPRTPVADTPTIAQEELVEAALAGRLRELIDAGLLDEPDSFCFSAFSAFERCPLAYALKYICGIEPAEPIPAFSFGTAAHRAFELFTAARRQRAAAGDEPPTRTDLDAYFAEAWAEVDFPDEATRASWFGRAPRMLDAFFSAEGQRASTTIGEELTFRMPIDLPDGDVVTLSGVIDRLDRMPDGTLELLDYKTGPAWGPATRTYGLQLAIYALGCRDALGLEVPRRALLYFVEHSLFAVKPLSPDAADTTRTEAAQRAAAIRRSDFSPTPSATTCRWCDLRASCPAAISPSPPGGLAAAR